LHTHLIDDESAYVLEGNLSVLIGEKMYDLEPGGFIYMPRQVPHRFIPRGTVTALSVQTPGGVFDALVEDVAKLLANGGELTQEIYQELEEKHGVLGSAEWYEGFTQPNGGES
jgi:glyoxylate utilization-related uncharacterized protein